MDSVPNPPENPAFGLVVVDGPNWTVWRKEIHDVSGVRLDLLNVARLLVGRHLDIVYVHLLSSFTFSSHRDFLENLRSAPNVWMIEPDRAKVEQLYPDNPDLWVDEKVQEVLETWGPHYQRMALISRDGDHIDVIERLKTTHNIAIVIPYFSLPQKDIGLGQPTTPPTHLNLIGIADKLVNLADFLFAGSYRTYGSRRT